MNMSSCDSDNCATWCLHHVDSVDVSFNKRVMGVGLSGWCVGANVHVFVTDINVSNGELGGRAINRYSCVLLLVCYFE